MPDPLNKCSIIIFSQPAPRLVDWILEQTSFQYECSNIYIALGKNIKAVMNI